MFLMLRVEGIGEGEESFARFTLSIALVSLAFEFFFPRFLHKKQRNLRIVWARGCREFSKSFEKKKDWKDKC